MANEVSVRLTRSAVIGGVTIGGLDEAVVADYQAVYKQTIPATTTNYEIDFPITISQAQVTAMAANGALTVKTNSTSAPDQTLTLVANVGYFWTYREPTARRVFTVDVTKLYVTNAGSTGVLFSVGVGADSTP